MRSLLLAWLLLGCHTEAPAPAPTTPPSTLAGSEPVTPPAPPIDPEQAALAKADAAIDALRKQLKARLTEVMTGQGPEAAVQVCASEAGMLAETIATEHGVKVGRASSRMRNPSRPVPEWVGGWLQAQGERPAEGVVGVRQVSRSPSGADARLLAPLAVEAPCLICHGPVDTIAPGVRKVLAERYPDDAATGYALGDLRGAVWAEASVVVAASTP